MMKSDQEMQFIVDRICTTWGIACYVLGKAEDAVICMPRVDTVQVLDKADLYYQQVAKCHTIMEMLGIYPNMMLDFSERVRRVNENRLSSDVEKCKDYIARNRTKKFTLSDLAENVGNNPSYLSDKFSRETDMTIQEYTKFNRVLLYKRAGH